MRLSEELILLSCYLERKPMAYIIKDDMILEKEQYLELAQNLSYSYLPVPFYQITKKGIEYITSSPTIIDLCIKFIETFTIKDEIIQLLKKLLTNIFTSLQKEDLCIYLSSDLEIIRNIAKGVFDTKS
jgi:hypothetical protein